MVGSLLKVLGVAGVGVGGSMIYASLPSHRNSFWKKELIDVGPILSCKGANGAGYELSLYVNGGGRLDFNEIFSPKVYKISQGSSKELTKDFLYFWLHYDEHGKITDVSLQTVSDASNQRDGTKVTCTSTDDARIEVVRGYGTGRKINLGMIEAKVIGNSCKPEGADTSKKTCDLGVDSGEYLKWKREYQPKIRYTLVS